MSTIETVIIVQRKDPAEAIDYNNKGECPECGTTEKPICQGNVYVCPECGYVGKIEDWFRN